MLLFIEKSIIGVLSYVDEKNGLIQRFITLKNGKKQVKLKKNLILDVDSTEFKEQIFVECVNGLHQGINWEKDALGCQFCCIAVQRRQAKLFFVKNERLIR